MSAINTKRNAANRGSDDIGGATGTGTETFLPFTITVPFDASVSTDLAIYNAAVPYALLVTDVHLDVATADAGITVTLRTAAAAGGNAITNAMSLAATGMVRTTQTTDNSLAADSSLYLNFSGGADTGAGRIYITCGKVVT